MSNDVASILKRLLRNPVLYSEKAGRIKLRSYQVDPVKAIVDSVLKGKGLSFVVMFSRQSGKNEIQAQIEAYLLMRLSLTDAELVKISPTWKPQSLNAMRRLERTLENNLICQQRWEKESGYIFRIGKARLSFFSGQPEANIVGATASALLQVDEAQDVSIAKYDKDIAPMVASTNATRVFYGTAWTSNTLLARELRAARTLQRRDKRRRVFIVNSDRVGRELPAYKAFVMDQIEKLGRQHPLVKTQFFCEEIDASGKMFTAARIALSEGSHKPQAKPEPNHIYCMMIDVAGEEEQSTDPAKMEQLSYSAHDATALSIVDVDLSGMDDPLIKRPIYRVVSTKLWTGEKQTGLFHQIKAMAELWRVQFLVVDATGIGAGLSSFLSEAFPGRVIPFIFTPQSKSKLGWDFLALIDTGRFKFPAILQEWELLKLQMDNCIYEIVPGPSKLLRWSVPDDVRGITGDLVHDDLLISCALVTALDGQVWSSNKQTIISAADPLADYDNQNW